MTWTLNDTHDFDFKTHKCLFKDNYDASFYTIACVYHNHATDMRETYI